MLGDSIIRNVGIECPDIKFVCFPGIRTEQLQRVIEERDLGNPDAVVIHVGTNNIKRTRNLDYLMGDVYDMLITVKSEFAASRFVLSGVLRRRDVSWRLIGETNDRLEWVASTVGITFVDPNCWVNDRDYSGDGIHINRRGARHLG